MKTLLVLGPLALLMLSLPAHAAAPTLVPPGDVLVLLKISAGSYVAPGEVCPVVVPAGANGGDVLDAAQRAGCITSWSHQTYPGLGRFVTCIDGLCQNPDVGGAGVDGTFWEFSVNQFQSDVGIDGYRASNLDVVGFDYAEYYVGGFVDYVVSSTLP
jgi:hypothetical protein